MLESCPFGDDCANERHAHVPAGGDAVDRVPRRLRGGGAAVPELRPCRSPSPRRPPTIDDTEPPALTETGWQRTAEVRRRGRERHPEHRGPRPGVQLHAAPAVPGGRSAPRSICRMASTPSRSRRTDAAGQSRTAPVTVRVDRVAPESPIGLSVAPGVRVHLDATPPAWRRSSPPTCRTGPSSAARGSRSSRPREATSACGSRTRPATPTPRPR